MGQSKWAWGCALLLSATFGSHVVAQDPADPFGGIQKRSGAHESEKRPGADGDASYSPGEAKQRINRILNQPLKQPLDFIEQPLRDVVTILSQTYDIPIQFDVNSLGYVATSPDVEVSVQIANVTLRSALDLMLKNCGSEELTYIIDDEVLLITTFDEEATRLEVIVYRVDDLIADGSSPWQNGSDADKLIEVIVNSVEYEAWQDNGTGEGEVNYFAPGMLVISQTSRVHTEVQRLLDDLRSNKAAVEAATPERRTAAAKRPVSRSIAINAESVAKEDSQRRIREALMKSVDWNPADAELAEEDKFLLILPDRVLVRHLPQVVAQVEHSVDDLNLAPPRGFVCDGRSGAPQQADLADSARASEDSGGRNTRGGGVF